MTARAAKREAGTQIVTLIWLDGSHTKAALRPGEHTTVICGRSWFKRVKSTKDGAVYREVAT